MKNRTKITRIGLVDADLLCNGTRHPNLALLKIAGFFRDNGFVRGFDANKNSYELITNECNFESLQRYDLFYVSCVFSFTLENPPLVLTTLNSNDKLKKKVRIGGTGKYANLSIEEGFLRERSEDMHRLENDKFLNTLKNSKGGYGIDMQTQMPDYHLYDDYVSVMENIKSNPTYYKDYKEYSIGFLTRGCFRQCPFCVNKLERRVKPYSKIEDFLDNETDEKTGKLKRPYIYLWDDNFLASPSWDKMLDELIATKRPFQFRQGLDERLLAQNPRGEEMAKKLANANYHGDFIFAFDNWNDRPVIERALKIWKKHNPRKGTKFYLFCGYEQTHTDKDKFYRDIWEIFQRIKVLMTYGCVGYLMRHEDYHRAPISNIYVQIARWCNQQQFYKKQSFWEFAYRNQSYWEEKTLGITDMPKWVSFEQFEKFKADGRYQKIKLCKTVNTVLEVLDMFPDKKDELVEMFSYKMSDLIDDKYKNNK